jgi:hypothetical protein
MTPTHPATGHPLLDQSEAEQALRVLAGLEPRPTCGTCSARGWSGVCWETTLLEVDHLDPACDLWEPLR